MRKHTPGPWGTDSTHRPDGAPWDEVEVHGDTGGVHVAIATVYSCWDSEDAPIVDGGANARLIAAAPELLVVAKEAESLIVDLALVLWGADFAKTVDSKRLNALRTAIAKAEGENS